MKTTTKTFQALIRDFFERHLAIERNASPNTIAAYRDALKLFLGHAAQAHGCSADRLDHSALAPTTVRSFLLYLERERGSAPRTRNHRLAALKSFARYVASVDPQHLERCRAIREIPPARVEHSEPSYLDDDEVAQLLHAVDGPSRLRDRALLLLLYNTGARVQEIVVLNLRDLVDESLPFVRLRGKGRKQRTCPLWPRTVLAIRAYLDLRSLTVTDPEEPLFLNVRGCRLSRSGIAYILQRAKAAATLEPRHATRLSPHVIRHTTAMHLLEAGVDITTIAAWLGHAQLTTTHGYIEINLRMKQHALAGLTAPPGLADGEYPSDPLIRWLEALGRRSSYVQHDFDQALTDRSPEPPLHITPGCA